MTNERLEAKAHKLIEHLAPGQLAAVVHLLEAMIEEEGEELSEQDQRAIAASREYFRNNPKGGLTFEQIAADCGVNGPDLES